MPARLANLSGRAVLLEGDTAYDVESMSGGQVPDDPMGALAHMARLDELAATLASAEPIGTVQPGDLGPCVPRPAKVIGVGLNYRGHASETGAEVPTRPLVFSKFSSCVVGPAAEIVLPSASTDYEAELVVVIGRAGRHVPVERALAHVAGYCVGQDVSERAVQFSGKPPQFDLGKSYDTFGPIGPAVVSLAALADPLDLAISCEVSGETMQSSRTADMIFTVPELISHLSDVCTLEVGDIIFTGTPAGVGMARDPTRFLAPGDEVVTRIEGVGEIRNRCVAAPPRGLA